MREIRRGLRPGATWEQINRASKLAYKYPGAAERASQPTRTERRLGRLQQEITRASLPVRPEPYRAPSRKELSQQRISGVSPEAARRRRGLIPGYTPSFDPLEREIEQEVIKPAQRRGLLPEKTPLGQQIYKQVALNALLLAPGVGPGLRAGRLGRAALGLGRRAAAGRAAERAAERAPTIIRGVGRVAPRASRAAVVRETVRSAGNLRRLRRGAVPLTRRAASLAVGGGPHATSIAQGTVEAVRKHPETVAKRTPAAALGSLAGLGTVVAAPIVAAIQRDPEPIAQMLREQGASAKELAGFFSGDPKVVEDLTVKYGLAPLLTAALPAAVGLARAQPVRKFARKVRKTPRTSEHVGGRKGTIPGVTTTTSTPFARRAYPGSSTRGPGSRLRTQHRKLTSERETIVKMLETRGDKIDRVTARTRLRQIDNELHGIESKLAMGKQLRIGDDEIDAYRLNEMERQAAKHEQGQLFTPQDVMPGQTGFNMEVVAELGRTLDALDYGKPPPLWRATEKRLARKRGAERFATRESSFEARVKQSVDSYIKKLRRVPTEWRDVVPLLAGGTISLRNRALARAQIEARLARLEKIAEERPELRGGMEITTDDLALLRRLDRNPEIIFDDRVQAAVAERGRLEEARTPTTISDQRAFIARAQEQQIVYDVPTVQKRVREDVIGLRKEANKKRSQARAELRTADKEAARAGESRRMLVDRVKLEERLRGPIKRGGPKAKPAEPFRLYHGTDAKIQGDLRMSETGVLGKAIYLGDTKLQAHMYGPNIHEFELLPEARIADFNELTDLYNEIRNAPDEQAPAIMERAGYDVGIRTIKGQGGTPGSLMGRREIIGVYNPKVLRSTERVEDMTPLEQLKSGEGDVTMRARLSPADRKKYGSKTRAAKLRITDHPDADLERFIGGGVHKPPMSNAARVARAQAAGKRTRAIQYEMGGTRKQRAMRGNSKWEESERILQEAWDEGDRSPHMVAYAWLKARSLLHEEPGGIESFPKDNPLYKALYDGDTSPEVHDFAVDLLEAYDQQGGVLHAKPGEVMFGESINPADYEIVQGEIKLGNNRVDRGWQVRDKATGDTTFVQRAGAGRKTFPTKAEAQEALDRKLGVHRATAADAPGPPKLSPTQAVLDKAKAANDGKMPESMDELVGALHYKPPARVVRLAQRVDRLYASARTRRARAEALLEEEKALRAEAYRISKLIRRGAERWDSPELQRAFASYEQEIMSLRRTMELPEPQYVRAMNAADMTYEVGNNVLKREYASFAPGRDKRREGTLVQTGQIDRRWEADIAESLVRPLRIDEMNRLVRHFFAPFEKGGEALTYNGNLAHTFSEANAIIKKARKDRHGRAEVVAIDRVEFERAFDARAQDDIVQALDRNVDPESGASTLRDTSAQYVIVDRAAFQELRAQLDRQSATLGAFLKFNRAQAYLVLGTSPGWLLSQFPATLAPALLTVGPVNLMKAVWRYHQMPEDLRVGYEAMAEAPHGFGMAAVDSVHGLRRGVVSLEIDALRAMGRSGFRRNLRQLPQIIRSIERSYTTGIRKVAVAGQIEKELARSRNALFRSAANLSKNSQRFYDEAHRALQAMNGKDVWEQRRYFIDNPEAAARIQTYIREMLGDWRSLTSRERNIAAVGFFYPFLRWSLRFTWRHFPMQHPIKATILAYLGLSNTAELRRLLGTYPSWTQTLMQSIIHAGPTPQDATLLSLARIAPGGNALVEAGATGFNAQTLRLVQPWFTALIEGATGYDTTKGRLYTNENIQVDPFTGKILRETDTGDVVYDAPARARAGLVMNELLRLSPLTRSLSDEFGQQQFTPKEENLWSKSIPSKTGESPFGFSTPLGRVDPIGDWLYSESGRASMLGTQVQSVKRTRTLELLRKYSDIRSFVPSPTARATFKKMPPGPQKERQRKHLQRRIERAKRADELLGRMDPTLRWSERARNSFFAPLGGSKRKRRAAVPLVGSSGGGHKWDKPSSGVPNW